MAERLLTPNEIKALFRRRVAEAGGVCAWARENDVSIAYVSGALSNGKDSERLGPLILGKLRAMKVERYVLVDEVEAVATDAREVVNA